MQLDDKTANAVSVRPTADVAGALRWFRERDLGGGITGTTMEQDFLNDQLGNNIALLAAAGITRTKGEAGDSDLLDSIKAIVGLNTPQGALSGHLDRQSPSVIRLRPVDGAQVRVGIDNKVLSKTGNLVWDMTADLEGAEGPSIALYLYVKDAAGVLEEQISPTAPDLPGGTKPGYKSGDPTRRCIGSTWNSAGSDLVPAIWGPGGEVRFTRHDADHAIVLLTAALTTWRNQTVKVPITASSVFCNFSARTPTNNGMVVYAADGATGTLPAGAVDPTAAGFEDTLIATESTGTGDQKGYGINAEIPIITPATPAISYGITASLIVSSHHLLVTGYRDIFAPR